MKWLTLMYLIITRNTKVLNDATLPTSQHSFIIITFTASYKG